MHDRSTRSPAIYAHRGSSIMAPENTLPAYEWSLEHGSAVLETDVRLSRDGCLFMFHDENLERTTDGSGLVADTTASRLKQLNAAAKFHRPGDPVARPWCVSLLTLEELFASYPTVPITIDIKDNSSTAADEVIRLVKRFERYELTVVGSFFSEVILYLRKKAPEIKTAALIHEVAQLYFGRFAKIGKLAKLEKMAKPAGLTSVKKEGDPTGSFQALQIPMSWYGIRLATHQFVRYGQQLGYDMVYWTVNDEATLKRLQQLGVDGVVTDRPDIAQRIFNAS